MNDIHIYRIKKSAKMRNRKWGVSFYPTTDTRYSWDNAFQLNIHSNKIPDGMSPIVFKEHLLQVYEYVGQCNISCDNSMSCKDMHVQGRIGNISKCPAQYML